MQYTGLKDKNGVDIYEGDLIEGDFASADYPVIAKVYWDEEYASWKADQYEGTEVTEFELWEFLGEWQFTRVIGNIYANPELLEQG